jgi:hypothetical protein
VDKPQRVFFVFGDGKATGSFGTVSEAKKVLVKNKNRVLTFPGIFGILIELSERTVQHQVQKNTTL